MKELWLQKSVIDRRTIDLARRLEAVRISLREMNVGLALDLLDEESLRREGLMPMLSEDNDAVLVWEGVEAVEFDFTPLSPLPPKRGDR